MPGSPVHTSPCILCFKHQTSHFRLHFLSWTIDECSRGVQSKCNTFWLGFYWKNSTVRRPPHLYPGQTALHLILLYWTITGSWHLPAASGSWFPHITLWAWKTLFPFYLHENLSAETLNIEWGRNSYSRCTVWSQPWWLSWWVTLWCCLVSPYTLHFQSSGVRSGCRVLPTLPCGSS